MRGWMVVMRGSCTSLAIAKVNLRVLAIDKIDYLPPKPGISGIDVICRFTLSHGTKVHTFPGLAHSGCQDCFDNLRSMLRRMLGFNSGIIIRCGREMYTAV